MTVFKKRLLTACVAAILTTAGTANATPVSFYQLTNKSPGIASQLSVDVTAVGANQVAFTFYNNVGTASSITDVYFDDGTLLGIASITSSGAGVAFSNMGVVAPPDLPGGENALPPFQTTAGFSADSDNPPVAKGVNSASEWLTITFNLQGGGTFADVWDELISGELRIGIHVQGIAGGTSDSYINNPPNVPDVPDGGMTISLLGLALTGIGLLARRRQS